MAKNIPVIIWVTRHSPSKEPKFHMYVKATGEGKLIIKSSAIFNSELVFLIGINPRTDNAFE